MGAAERNLDPWARGYDLGKYPGGVREDGIGALIDTVMQSPEPVTIIAIGAVPNLADALSREPRIAAKCHFVGMQGSFDLGYGGSGPAAAEANVRGDPAACAPCWPRPGGHLAHAARHLRPGGLDRKQLRADLVLDERSLLRA